MATVVPARRSVLKPLAFALAGLLGVMGLVVGGWSVWSLLRPPPTGFAPTTGHAANLVSGPSHLFQYTVDARSRRDWAYFDFSEGSAVPASRDSLDWDLAFRRTDILTNGGETNPQGLGAALDLGEIPLGEADPPAEGYVTDVIDEERGLENPHLHKWYNYNWITHVVTSKNHTYAVRAATGEVVLLTFLSYYCEDGSAGCVTFQYLYPDAP